MRTNRRRGRQAGRQAYYMTKLIVAFRCFAKAPKSFDYAWIYEYILMEVKLLNLVWKMIWL